MPLQPFTPVNDLEAAIAAARSGELPMERLLDQMAAATLFVPSREEVAPDGRGFVPLLLGQAGNALVAAFSNIDRPTLHCEVASYLLPMSGRTLFGRLPPAYGLVVNPGFEAQLVISPDAVADTRRRVSGKPPGSRTPMTGRSRAEAEQLLAAVGRFVAEAKPADAARATGQGMLSLVRSYGDQLRHGINNDDADEALLGANLLAGIAGETGDAMVDPGGDPLRALALALSNAAVATARTLRADAGPRS